MTPHNEAKKEYIAKIVLMPGDPLRAKYIADNFLNNAVLVNSVRNMLAYTGFYKGTKITVMASGMGMPSIGIYSYELYKFYDVDVIIRIGSCGGYKPDLKLFDTILVEKSYTEGNFALTMANDDCHLISASSEINSLLEEIALQENIPYRKGTTLCTECFDLYMKDTKKFFERLPSDIDPVGAEMEAFALFYTAHYLNKKAACLLTVVDSKFCKEQASAEDREKSLNNMITLALETTLKLK